MPYQDPVRKVKWFVDGTRIKDGRKERIGTIFANINDTQERINEELRNFDKRFSAIKATPLSGDFADNYEPLEASITD